MLTKFDKFIANIKVKEEKISRDYGDYSAYTQIIKNERIRRNQTLETMAKGICSVSYLSKLENNAIKPSEDYVKALLERVNIDYDDIARDNYESQLMGAVRLYFFDNELEIKKLYDSLYNGLFDARIAMIKCFYLLKQNDFKEFFEMIEQLDEIKNSLVGYQAIVLIFLVSEYYRKVSRYKDCYNYLICLKELNIENYELKMLVNENYMIASLNLLKFSEVQIAYIEYKKNELICCPPLRKLKCGLIEKIARGKNEYNEEELDSVLFFISNIDVNNELYYYICLNHLLCDNYKKVLILLEGKGDLLSNSKFLALYCKTIYQLEKSELYEELTKRIDSVKENMNDLTEVDVHYLTFLKMNMINEESYQNFEFLRYTILPYINSHYNIVYNNDYEKMYVNILMKLSRYKEAANHLLNLVDRT